MIFLILFVVLTVISQILLKKASVKNEDRKSLSYLTRMLRTPSVLFAYSLSLVNIFVWILAISEVSLLLAFFFTSSIYVIMVMVDHFLFKQPVGLIKIIGIGFITAGVLVLSISSL